MRKAIDSGYWSGIADQKTLGHIHDAFIEWKQDLVKMGRLKNSTVNAYHSRLCRIIDTIGISRDASSIRYRHVHEFLYKSGGAPKSIYDSYTIFKEMIEWAFDMGDITAKPKWPPFDFSPEHDMKRRKTVDKATQARILHDIYIREWNIRPRLYLAIRFLSTYISLRPSELLHIKEKDLDREMGLLTITCHKTSRRPKVLRLLPQDIGIFRELPRGMPDMPLFRYDVPCGAIRAGTGFGQGTFYRAWKRSCKNLGISEVDLYGGTRHSSAIALYKDAGVPVEEIKKATGHKTSIAFTRYFKLDIDDVVEIHALAAPKEEVI
jgi:integrase